MHFASVTPTFTLELGKTRSFFYRPFDFGLQQPIHEKLFRAVSSVFTDVLLCIYLTI